MLFCGHSWYIVVIYIQNCSQYLITEWNVQWNVKSGKVCGLECHNVPFSFIFYISFSVQFHVLHYLVRVGIACDPVYLWISLGVQFRQFPSHHTAMFLWSTSTCGCNHFWSYSSYSCASICLIYFYTSSVLFCPCKVLANKRRHYTCYIIIFSLAKTYLLLKLRLCMDTEK